MVQEKHDRNVLKRVKSEIGWDGLFNNNTESGKHLMDENSLQLSRTTTIQRSTIQVSNFCDFGTLLCVQILSQATPKRNEKESLSHRNCRAIERRAH